MIVCVLALTKMKMGRGLSPGWRINTWSHFYFVWKEDLKTRKGPFLKTRPMKKKRRSWPLLPSPTCRSPTCPVVRLSGARRICTCPFEKPLGDRGMKGKEVYLYPHFASAQMTPRGLTPDLSEVWQVKAESNQPCCCRLSAHRGDTGRRVHD